jgi:sarcosine oxidase, subunit alpha
MNSGPYRLDSGGLIDRSRVLAFEHDGRRLSGFGGDTLASALLANGQRIVGRSMKFHRPRGVFSSGMEEPNGLVQLGDAESAIPSARATLVPLAQGLRSRSQAGWPSVQFDVLRVLDAAAPLFAAGFYNKTFMWPRWSWFEPAIRRLAGLGTSPVLADPDHYELRNAWCDVLVVGGGVAGLSAARAAARNRMRVCLVEQEGELGGRARWSLTSVQGGPIHDWIRAVSDELAANAEVRLLTRTVAVGSYECGLMMLLETCRKEEAARERLWIVRAKRLVLATGAIEQPMIFENNDRPGIMLAGAAHCFLKCHAVAPGRRVMLATNNDSAYDVAQALVRASVHIVGIMDSRKEVQNPRAADLRARGIPLHLETLPLTTTGSKVLRSVAVGTVRGSSPSASRNLACDSLLISGGWNPNLHLFAQSGGKLVFDDNLRALVPSGAVPGIEIVGAAASIADVDHAIAHASDCGAGKPSSGLARERDSIGPRFSSVGNPWRQWVDLLHDVTVGDLKLAVQENYSAIEHVKRYTTVGMAVDQGKTSSVPALEIVAELRNTAPSAIGHTTMRPPTVPVTLGAIAAGMRGSLFAPLRETPLHAWHTEHGASVDSYGAWLRPACYRQPGEEQEAAIQREARLVRTSAGLFDASSLGKIEIHGPDALEFVDRFYINRLDTIKAGRARYGIMLRETGTILDDGLVMVLASDHVLVTTTSGNSSRVASWFEEWHQCEWPSLRVAITQVTDNWATLGLSGPASRQILAALEPSCDLSNEGFPHLGIRTATLLGVSVRICRVSFSGELTYEINVPARAAVKAWEALLAAGSAVGLAPFGVESLLRLRLEKGYLHVGTDTDGTTIPDDIGWGAAVLSKERDFIGKRSLLLPEHLRQDRLQLVGLQGADNCLMPVGGHVRVSGSSRSTDGWITSVGRLTSDGSPIGLALIRGGRARMKEMVDIYDVGHQKSRAKIVAPPFYDPAGARLHG